MDASYWTTELQAAELELDAATRLPDVNLAASRFMRAREALKRIEAEQSKRPKRRTTRGSRAAGVS
jgi:hypothetical protein